MDVLIVTKDWIVEENNKSKTLIFLVEIGGASDSKVYDYTEQIEHANQKVVWRQDIYHVIRCGIKTDFTEGRFYFYIEAEPLLGGN